MCCQKLFADNLVSACFSMHSKQNSPVSHHTLNHSAERCRKSDMSFFFFFFGARYYTYRHTWTIKRPRFSVYILLLNTWKKIIVSYFGFVVKLNIPNSQHVYTPFSSEKKIAWESLKCPFLLSFRKFEMIVMGTCTRIHFVQFQSKNKKKCSCVSTRKSMNLQRFAWQPK